MSVDSTILPNYKDKPVNGQHGTNTVRIEKFSVPYQHCNQRNPDGVELKKSNFETTTKRD